MVVRSSRMQRTRTIAIAIKSILLYARICYIHPTCILATVITLAFSLTLTLSFSFSHRTLFFIFLHSLTSRIHTHAYTENRRSRSLSRKLLLVSFSYYHALLNCFTLLKFLFVFISYRSIVITKIVTVSILFGQNSSHSFFLFLPRLSRYQFCPTNRIIIQPLE